MGVKDRYNKKKQGVVSETNTQRKEGVKDRYFQNKNTDTSVVNEGYYNTFLKEAKDFHTTFNDPQADNTRYKTWQGLNSKINTLKVWLRQNKNKLTEESYKNISETIGSFDSYSDYFADYMTEDDYLSAMKNLRVYEDKSTLDLAESWKEISNLERQYGIANAFNSELSLWLEGTDNGENSFSNYHYTELENKYRKESKDPKVYIKKAQEEYTAYVNSLKNDLAKSLGDFKSIDEMASVLADKRAYHNHAEYIQNGIKMNSVADPKSENYDPEFETYTQKGKEALNGDPSFAMTLLYWKDEMEQMTEDEWSTYYYHVGKGGLNQGAEYLKANQETFSYRAGKKKADEVDTAIGKLFFGLEAGLNQFGTGMANLFKDDNYFPANSTQVASGIIREDMAEDGWGWAYDLVNTTGNMVPSIITSAALSYVNPVLGQAAGSILMGSSAAGNAYAEAINLGYAKEQAAGYGFLVGASEAGLQYLLGGISKLGGNATSGLTTKIATKLASNVDSAFAKIAITSGTKLVGSMVSEFGEEYLQEVLTPVFKNAALGTNEDVKLFSSEALYAGFLGALSAGLLEGVGTVRGEIGTYQAGKKVVSSGQTSNLVKLGSYMSADTVAYKIASQVNENTDAYTLGLLLREAGADSLSESNIADITAELTNRGMTLSDAQSIAKWLNKAVEGEYFTDGQISALENNEIISEVYRNVILNNDSSVNQRLQAYQSINENLASKKSDADVTSNESSEGDSSPTNENTDVSGMPPYSAEQIESVAKVFEEMGIPAEEAKSVAIAQLSGGNTNSSPAVENPTQSENKTSDVGENLDAEGDDGTDNRALTLADVSKNYGAQAGAMVATYNIGGGNQDVAKYDKAYRAAYDMGNSGVALSYAMNSESTAYLTEKQRELAHEAGKAASDASAKEQEAKNKKAINGKKGRKKGVVKGESVTISDLKKSFNDTQNVAYKVLTTYAEATGIDIVLYKSEADADGNFVGSQGKFKWSEDTIYIDINAGLAKLKDVKELAKYAMLRTFSHEFTHFIEKWNPVYYNEFRKAVFDTLTERGENVHDLIEEKMSMTEGMTYEKASREVVAEAMTDILPDASFVETLATKHKNIFDKLLEKLKEFLADLKAYFNTIGNNRSREANALKEQVEGAVHYVDNIVKLFDKVAAEAVENYQMTVAVDEVIKNSAKIESTDTISADNNAETKVETAKTDKYDHFTITDNMEFGSLEITFDGKPSEAVRDVLKANKFRWHGKKGVWYGKGKRADIVKALLETYETQDVVKETNVAPEISNPIKEDNTNVGEETAEVVGETGRGTEKSLRGAQTEDSNERGVSEESGRGTEIRGNSDTLRERYGGLSRFTNDAYITAQNGTVEYAESAVLSEYGIENYVVKRSAWDKEVIAFARDGKVYMREGLEESHRDSVSFHEATHVMYQLGYKPYMDFVERTPEMLNMSAERTLAILEVVEKHRKMDALNTDDTSVQKMYDEFNAIMYGHIAKGLTEEQRAKLSEVFNDFDAYEKELSAIHNQFKAERKGVNSEEVQESSLDKKTVMYFRRAVRTNIVEIDGQKFITDGILVIHAADADVSFAKKEFGSKEVELPKQSLESLSKATTLITEAPMEATLNKPVYVFDVNGDKMYFDKKLFSHIDGGLLYFGKINRGYVIKSVNEDGTVKGYILSMIAPKTDSITDMKPSKLKSFSKKMQPLINGTTNNVEEVNDNGENVDNRSTVRQPDTDRQGDSQVLDELQAEDVSGDAQRGDTVGGAVERGQEAGRDDVQPDATGTGRGPSEGDSQSGDIRRYDELTPEAKEKLHEEVTEQIAQQSTELPKGKNFVIGDSLDLPNGEKARYKANIDAIKLVKQLEAEGRYATEAEQVILSKYVGWGGLANAFDERKADWSKEYTELKELLTKEEYELARGSTLNAHYTDISVIKAMYDGLNKLGFNGGRMMEPSSGVGNFVGAMPADMSAKVKSWTMVELDSITGLIAKYLYPNADVRIQGFEKANIPNNYMDVIISNVPFGNYPITDKAYPKKVTSAIHNYFFAKSLDKVRPGGIVMFITSSYTMNSKDETVRRYIMQRADLLGAIRLPDSAFKGNAGTEVVTDILILKKRAANTEYAGENFLEAPFKYVNGYNGAYINGYFDAHPEMVLGTATMDGGMYRGNNLTYKALEGKGSLADQIREAFNHIKGKMDYPAKPTPEKTNFAVERVGKKTKADGYVAKDGKIYQNKDGELVEQTVTAKVAERIKGMLEIRDAARDLQSYQQQGLNETEIKKARTKLNKVYDAFVKKNGFLNSPANKSAFNGDPDRYSLFALENWDNDKKTATKTDIFSKNTIAPNRTVVSAKDVSEGLIVSVNQTGGVDTALIARLTGKTEADVKSELIESRKVFKNRDGVLETAETYLSGNVRAKLRDAEALAPIDKDYQKNVEALKSVMPEDVSYQDIFVNPGTPWIPSSVYSDFAAYMLGGRNTEWRQDIDVTRNPETGNFTVELKSGYLKHNAQNTQKWGTPRRSFIDLFDAMLNSKSVVVKDKLSDGSFEINKDATAAANEKIENITKEFQEWLWKDEARRTELATLYNEIFNSIVTPKYDGDNLTVNGANAMKPLRPHQRNAVQRVISSGGNTLLAHKVGAGKTYEMAAAAMKLKELGLVKKPLFAVPKSLVAQWGTEFIDFFPTAKLLVAEASDFATANRKVFMNRIANGEYDAVIVSYEQFEKLPVSDDFTRELYQEQINSIIAAIEEAKAEKGAKAMSVKDLEKKRKSLQAKIDKLTDKAKDEGNIDFEELGVDSLFIDEAHNFKNLFYTTSMTNVSGLGNKDGSKRAFDLYTKVRYLQKLNGGKGIVFATATPVMNSMSEMYIMQKYLQPDLLEQLGLNTFDAWAKQFGEVVNGVEIKPSGQGYRVKQSFSRFKNMSELQLLFRNFADVLTDIPGLKIPKMKGGKVNVVVCEPGEFQKNYMKELEKRADNIKNVDPSEDNMLKITSDGRKISYTQRMIDPSLPYEEGCKIYRCADNVVKTYNESNDVKGTQLIFCDMATPKGKSKAAEATESEDNGTDMESAKLYDDIKARLIQGGIPAKEIAFIHEADTDQKKKKLFADVNEGKVRVLIGSTGKMGVGMNAQRRVVAIHHLDAPWRPGDVEQRNGRAYRQGNINDEVECFNYVTEGSFDARLWDILERKQNFINQVMNGESVGRETEDTGEVTLSAAEVKALASGSPLIMEQVQLDTDIKKLESLYRAHNSAILNAKSKLEQDKATIATHEKRITEGKADIQARTDTYSEGKFAITVGNQKFTEKKDAGIALMAEAEVKAVESGYTTIGSFAGFDVRVVKTHEGIKGLISGKQAYSFNTYPGNTTFMINHLIATVEGIDEKISAWEQIVSEARKDITAQEELIATPFAKQAELDQKRTRYNEVMDILNPKEEQSLDSVAEDTVQEQSRKYLEDEKPKKHNKHSKHSETETLFLTWSNGSAPVGETKRFFRFGKVHYYEKTENGCIELSREQYEERGGFDVKNLDRRVQRKISGTVNSNGSADRNSFGSLNGNRNTGGTSSVSRQTLGEKLRNDTAGSVSGIGRDNRRTPVKEDDEQHQQRTETLTDSEVLALATSELLADDDLTTADKDAIEIIQKHLSNLEDLQADRSEQGRLYKEQQFGAKVDRAEAAKTLNRMKTLDQQIEKVSEELLSLENKGVLKNVLQKARTVVEKQERQHGQENLKRWRDRRNNADAIKKYRNRIRGDVDELSNWILHPNNKDIVKHVPDVLKNSVIPFLSSINFMSKRSLDGGNATISDKEFIKRLEALQSAIKTNIDVHGLYSGYNDLPADFLDSLQHFTKTAQVLVDKSAGEFIINQMTSEELKNLSKVVRTLKKYIMQINRFHNNAMYSHVYEAGENSIEHLKELDDAGNTGAISNFLFWQQIRPAYAFERFGNGGIAIYDGLRRGQAKLAFNTKEIQSFAEKAYTEKEVKEWENEIKTFSLGKDLVKMPVSYIMGFYELSKDPEALEHINGEGIRVATYTHKGKKISDVGHVLTVGEFNQIISSLTDRQKEVADSLQKYMATQGAKWGNYVSVARFGEELFTNQKYYPINSDGRHLSANADEHPSAAALYALLNMSFTKSRKEGANNRIVIYSIFDVFANHMASMAQYNAMALPILDALKWFNYQQVEIDDDGNKHIGDSVRERMDRAYGVPEETRPGKGKSGYAQDFVMNIIKAFNGTEAQGTPYDSLGLKSLHRYNIAQVAYNLRVVVQQPMAITRAGMLIDFRSILKGLKLKPSAIKNNIEEMQKYSGIAAWKSLGFYDVNISRGLTSIIKHDNSLMDKISDVGMWGAEKADLLTWSAIWSACKEEVKKKQHLTPESEGFYEAVTKLFEDVIYKTQVVDSVLTKNEFMRDKGTFARLTGSFMSEPTTNASMLIDAYDKYRLDIQRGMTRRQAWQKNGKMIGRRLYVYGVGAVLLAAVQAAVDALRDDDDYEEWYEKWLEAFGGNFVDEIMPFNKLPIMSDFYDLAKELLSIIGVDTYGNPPQSVFMQWYDNLINGTEIIYDKISGEDTNYTWYGGIFKLLQAISGMSGIPMASATREIITAWNNTVGAFAPSLKLTTYEPSELSQIKYAYEDGYLTDEEATAQILEKGLADNENEAYFIIQGWEVGDGYSRYDELYNTVLNGGDISAAMDELTSHGYSEEDVISQIKGQVGKWYYDSESEVRITKQQAIDMLDKYTDMTDDEITSTVNRWSCVVVTGIKYDDIDDEFMNGNITASRAIEMFSRYGSMTKEKATEKVTVLQFVKDNPSCEGISYSAVEGYKTYCEPSGVPAETFYDVWKYNSSTSADVDKNGNSVSGSKKEKVLKYINSLSLSRKQKDSLYYAFGWAESKLYEAPWH